MDRKPHVLVVDDDEDLRLVTTMVLGEQADRLGFRLSEAAGGQEALGLLAKAVKGGGPILMITDSRMPGMDGPELARRARDAHPDASIRIVLLTSLDPAVSGSEEGPKAVDAVVAKPFGLDELRRQLTELVEDWLGT